MVLSKTTNIANIWKNIFKKQADVIMSYKPKGTTKPVTQPAAKPLVAPIAKPPVPDWIGEAKAPTVSLEPKLKGEVGGVPLPSLKEQMTYKEEPVTEPIEPEKIGTDKFAKAKEDISKILEGQEDKVDEIVKAIGGLAEVKQTAFDKLFGKESKISSFYAPSVQAVEEQILDTEELLTNLKMDVQKGLETGEVTQSQFRRIEAKERGGLIDQMDKLVRAKSRLQAGLETQMALSEKEYDMVVEDAKQGIEALKFSLEQSGQFDQMQIGLIEKALDFDLDQDILAAKEVQKKAAQIEEEEATQEEETEKEKAKKIKDVEEILMDAQDFVVKAGAVPSEKFKKVISDAMQMVEEGATLSEIQLGVMQAIGQNPKVKAYIEKQFKKAKGGGKKDQFFSTAQLLKLKAAGQETGVPEIDVLSEEQASVMSGSSDLFNFTVDTE